jgi:hypothetical protein
MKSAPFVPVLGFALFAAGAAGAAAPGEPPPAQPATTTAAGTASAGTDEEEIVVPPAAHNTLGGHFQLGASALLATPFAHLDSDTTFRERAHGGFGFAADAGIGVSRSVVLGAYGQYLRLDEGSDCASCDPSSIGAGVFARYHLVQGVRFDPWASLGVGYRSFDTGDAQYTGIEWLRLTVGGDWYALSQIGFGPYLELDFGSFFDTPSGSDTAVYATFAAGFRLVFDAQGK